MAQQLLERAHVHAALEHERGRCVPQLVGGDGVCVQTGLQQRLVHHHLDGVHTDPLAPGGEKDGVFVRGGDVLADGKPVVQRLDAGVVEIDDPLLAALAVDQQTVLPDVGQIQSDHLRDSQAAVEEKTEDAVIPLLVFSVHRREQPLTLFQRQIVGEGFLQLGRVQIQHRVIG